MRNSSKVLASGAAILCAAAGLTWAGVTRSTHQPSLHPVAAKATPAGKSTPPKVKGAAEVAPQSPKAAAAVTPPGVKGKVYAGWQGWFGTPGDGSPTNGWVHWNAGQPSPGHQTFEVYPDMSMYPASSQAQTGYTALGNGKPSTLFSSYSSAVVDQQFSWMKQYGIDGAAVQRFGNDIANPTAVRTKQRNAITVEARAAAEKYGRGFYVAYDMSGLNDNNLESTLESDWTNTVVNTLHLTDSPMYAHEDGKPVVSIWGLGFTNRAGTPQNGVALINWFKSKGLYVIGGVPRGWATDTGAKPGFAPVYRDFDMISPWRVGTPADNAAEVKADFAALNATGQDYQPVVYPGFAWSNWHTDAPHNEIPRNKGEFFWKQAVNIRQAGVKQAYVAMFDEYDEGTAIAPAASDSSEIPTNQYFLTTSADGTFVSSDFYLRLAGSAERMITGRDPVSSTVPIPPSAGPVYFRTSLEKGLDAQPTWTNTAIPGGTVNVTNPTLGVTTGADHELGTSALEIKGSTPTTAHSHAYMKAFSVNIPVKSATKLTYGFLPKDAGGRNVAIDLVMSDGSSLRDSAATTTTGVDMHPGAPKGTVGNWSTVRSDVGTWLNGKTIAKIVVGYDRTNATGPYDAFIDNIAITDN